MSFSIRLQIVILAGLLSTAISFAVAPSAGLNCPKREMIHAYICQLGSSSSEIRDKAQAQLQGIPEAESQIRQGLFVRDPEVQRRCKRLLKHFVLVSRTKAIDRLRIAIRAGHVDLVAEIVSQFDWGNDYDHCPQALLDLGWSIHRFASTYKGKFGQRFVLADDLTPRQNYRDYVRRMTSHPILLRPAIPGGNVTHPRKGSIFVAFGSSFQSADRVSRSLIATSDSMHIEYSEKRTAVSDSFLFSAGSIRISGGNMSVIVCDQCFTAEDHLFQSIVISGGSVTCPSRVSKCLIIAAGPITIPPDAVIADSVLRSNSRINCPKSVDLIQTDVESHQTRLVGPISFYQTKESGIELGADSCVLSLNPTKMFTRASVKLHDRILKVDGHAVANPDTFRRLLRRRIAIGGMLDLTIQRGRKNIVLRFEPQS